MMKVHQGVDLVEISKFRRVVEKNPQLLEEIFTEKERAYCQLMRDSTLHFAGRFAAKEAYAKALGMGFSVAGVDHLFQEIEIVPSPSGRPEIAVHGWAAKMSKKRRIAHCSLSISHTSSHAIAAVLLIQG